MDFWRILNRQRTEVEPSQPQNWQSTADYIKKNVKRLECKSFVKNERQKESDEKICECRMRWEDHTQIAKDNEKHGVQWTWNNDTTLLPTNGFGYINFDQSSVEFKPYVRVAIDSSVDQIRELLVHYWRLHTPNLLISVTGGAKDFQVCSHLRQKFQKGLVKAALTTGAWIVTGGMNEGVMRYVGEAVRDSGYLASQKPAVAIGIAAWGCVHGRDSLVSEEGKWPASYTATPVGALQESNLDSNHSHFILVDNGSQSSWGSEIKFRMALEESIRDHLKVPACLFVMEGGEGTLDTWYNTIRLNIPTIIIKGSGRVADMLAYAYEKIKFEEMTVFDENGADVKQRIPSFDQTLRVEIKDMIVNGCKFRDPERNMTKFISQVESMCAHHDLVTIYEMDSAGSGNQFDLSILNGILAARSNTLAKLKLALKWNRPDVAREKIMIDEALKEYRAKPSGFHDLMFEAISKNRVEFVELFLENHVDLKIFLTYNNLHKLYKTVDRCSVLGKLLSRVTNFPEGFELKHVSGVVKLLTKIDYIPKKCFIYDKKTQGDEPMDRAIAQLFIWSVLMGYHKMSKIFWREGMEQIATALLGHTLFKNMWQFVKDQQDQDLKTSLEACADDYSDIAAGLIDECYNKNEKYTHQLLTRVMDNNPWNGNTCAEIALQSKNKDFLARPACRSLAQNIWQGPLKSQVNLFLILLTMIFPPLMWLIFRDEVLKRRGYSSYTERVCLHTTITDECPENPVENYDDLNRSRDKKPILSYSTSQLSQMSRPSFLFNKPSRRESFIKRFFILLYVFYHCPQVKLLLDVIFYLSFLLLYSYILVVKLEEDFQYHEAILLIWGLSFILLEVREILLNESTSTFTRIMKHLTQGYNRLDFLMIVTFIAAYVLRFTLQGHYFIIVRIAFSLNFNAFFFRIFMTFSASKRLGPMVPMLVGMIHNLLAFLVFLIMFIYSYTITSEAILYPNTELSWLAIYHLPRKAYWIIYGHLFLEDIEGLNSCTNDPSLYSDYTEIRCPTDVGKYVVPIFMAVYILLTQVLLINMLIAMFNDTYKSIKENSNKVWSYLRFHLIDEYSRRPASPPPLTIISQLIRAIRWLWDTKCFSKKIESDTDFRRRYVGQNMKQEERKLIHWENVTADEYFATKTAQENQELQNGRYILKRLNNLETVLKSMNQTMMKLFTQTDDSDNDPKQELGHLKYCPNTQSRRIPSSDKVERYPERYPVPDDKVDWRTDYPGYAPVRYTWKEALRHDFDLDSIDVKDRDGKLKFNQIDNTKVQSRRNATPVDRTSLNKIPYKIVDGLPQNPVGRTGMAGRGCLFRWGPNRAWDPVITRWKRDSTGNRVNKEGKYVLEVLVVLRTGESNWSFPGGFESRSRKTLEKMKVDFKIEGQESLSQIAAKNKIIKKLQKTSTKVYEDYADVSMNTDNAWVETTVENFHDETGGIFQNVRISAGSDTRFVKWQTVCSSFPMWGNQSYFLRLVADHHRAYFWRKNVVSATARRTSLLPSNTNNDNTFTALKYA